MELVASVTSVYSNAQVVQVVQQGLQTLIPLTMVSGSMALVTLVTFNPRTFYIPLCTPDLLPAPLVGRLGFITRPSRAWLWRSSEGQRFTEAAHFGCWILSYDLVFWLYRLHNDCRPEHPAFQEPGAVFICALHQAGETART